MSERGGQPGNHNATKNKPWIRAIERALAKRSKVAQVEALDDLAEKLLANCEKGDMAALRELGDRLDGKPNQSISGPDGDGVPVSIKVRYVSPGG